MGKQVSKAEEAMEDLMKVIQIETERFDSIEDPKARKDAAESIAVLADKVQKLEDTTNAKRSGSKEFWLKVGMITAETSIGIAGLVLSQKNLKYIRAFEEENVIRTDVAKAVSKAGLGVADRVGRIVRNIKF